MKLKLIFVRINIISNPNKCIKPNIKATAINKLGQPLYSYYSYTLTPPTQDIVEPF